MTPSLATDASQPSPLTTPVIRVIGVRVTFPAPRRASRRNTLLPRRLEALRSIDLDVPAGQSVALLGPNGSGKSTLLRVICGLQPPDDGRIEVVGYSHPHEIRRRLSVVFQTNGLDPHLTILENLRCQARLYGLSRADADNRIDDELRRLGLDDRRNQIVKTLSGGLARRADLARAMLHRPRVLLLDEPTVGLDPQARVSFLDGLELRRRDSLDPADPASAGLTILMTTHLIDEADRCDRVVFIHQGQIVADDAPAALRRGLGGRVITLLDGAPPPRDNAQSLQWQPRAHGWVAILDSHFPSSSDLSSEAHAFKAWGPSSAPSPSPAATPDDASIASLLTRAGRAFSIAPPTLADVFAKVTGRDLTDNLTTSSSATTQSPEAAA